MATEAEKWRLRERGLALGIVQWTIAVGLMLAFDQQLVIDFLEQQPPTVVVGSVLVSVGVAGAVGHTSLLLARRWVVADTDTDLTKWDNE